MSFACRGASAASLRRRAKGRGGLLTCLLGEQEEEEELPLRVEGNLGEIQKLGPIR